MNCTPDASASRSRWRATAACRMRPGEQPDITQHHDCEAHRYETTGAALARRPVHDGATDQPDDKQTKTHPMSCTFSRMSPLKTCENSWPITPCSSSRFRRSRAPWVTVMQALAGVWPAAKALMPAPDRGHRPQASAPRRRSTFPPRCCADACVSVGGCHSSRVRRPRDGPPLRRPRAIPRICTGWHMPMRQHMTITGGGQRHALG